MAALGDFLARLTVNRRAAAQAVALQSLQSLTYLPMSAGVGWLVDHVLSDRTHDLFTLAPTIAAYLAANIVLYAVHASITVHAFAASQRVARTTSAQLRSEVVDRLFTLRLSFVEKRGAGALAHRLTTDVAQIETFASLVTSRLVPSIVLGALAMLYLAIVEPMLALLTLAVVPLSMIISRRAEKRLEHVASSVRTSGESFSSAIVETALGLRHLRSLGADAIRRRALASDIDHVRTTGLEAGIAMTRAALALQMVSDLLPVLVWSAGGALFLAGLVTMGSLVAFVALLAFVQGALATITDAHRTWLSTRPAWAATTELLGTDQLDVHGDDVVRPIDGSIALDHVSVAHGERIALDDVTLRVASGEHLAIVGPSGAGKSTLLDLLAGLTSPTRGGVRWSSLSAAEAGRATLRASIAVVPQETFLFRTTLRENVRMGRPTASDADIEAACSRAGLAPLLARLQGGLDTPIDERGQNLSGGERQRLAIARLFLRDPRIVILDEPTSALDPETEAALWPELDALFVGRTAIVVTHRLVLARRASRVIELRDGKIVADGKPDEVLRATT
jgi:ATP-binding cassette subfamily B protein